VSNFQRTVTPFEGANRLQLTEMVDSRYSRISTMARDLKPKTALSPAVLHILLALAREDLHGYGITTEIARQSNGQYKMGPGTLYDNLKKLMDLELVIDAPADDLPTGESRRLYHLTEAGHAALTAEIERLKVVLREARIVLGSGRPRRT
jgi:DNA-binding PadR family transcriptional regulator